MGPGVRGPPGLPAVPIAYNLGVGTVIILNLQMAGDTARAMIWLPETVPVACVNVSYMLNKIYICFYSLGINHLYSKHFFSNRKDEIKTCILANVFENYTFSIAFLEYNHLYSKSISLQTERMV